MSIALIRLSAKLSFLKSWLNPQFSYEILAIVRHELIYLIVRFVWKKKKREEQANFYYRFNSNGG